MSWEACFNLPDGETETLLGAGREETHPRDHPHSSTLWGTKQLSRITNWA